MLPTPTKKFILFSFKILIFFTAANSSCDDGKRDIHNYYFPLKKLKTQPKVYIYNYTNEKGELLFKTHWYYETIVQGDSVWFVGTCTDSLLNTQFISREKRLNDGMILASFQFFGNDGQGHLISEDVHIINPASFPFAISQSNGVFVSTLEYSDLLDSLKKTTITRNRRYLKDTSVVFEGKKHDAIIFLMKEEQVERQKQHGDWQHVYDIQEVYAEGIGLFQTRRTIVNPNQLIGTLERIITMEEFEKEFR